MQHTCCRYSYTAEEKQYQKLKNSEKFMKNIFTSNNYHGIDLRVIKVTFSSLRNDSLRGTQNRNYVN